MRASCRPRWTCWLRCVHIARTSGQRWVQWDMLAFWYSVVWQEEEGQPTSLLCNHFATSPLPLPPCHSLHSSPSSSPPLKVLESKKTLMKHVLSALQGEEFGMKVAALKCILFWSRSPQQLRTTLIDYEVWRPLQEVCVGEGGGGRHHCVSVYSYQAVCMLGMAHCCYIDMLHRSCCSCAPIGNDCVCNVPLQLLSNRNETILILASAAVGNFLLPVSASRQVCVCVCAYMHGHQGSIQ